MNYRKYYEKETNKKIPKGWDVHHLDFNRKNNNISNLVALPKELHSKYHFLLQQTGIISNPISFDFFIPSGISDRGIFQLPYELRALKSLIDTYSDIQFYISYREDLINK